MRSDLIAAGMVRSWLDTHAPHLVNGWSFEFTDELQGFVNRVKTMVADIDAQFVTQAAVPRTAITHWNLSDVVVLGGGMPSPFSPRPHEVRYYTDINPAVVDEVGQMGYPTRQVDVRSLDDLKTLDGANTALAIGLFHFLDDAAAHQTLRNLLDAGFERFVYNNMNFNVSDELVATWGKLGFVLYRREPDGMRAILPDGWKMEQAVSASDFLAHNPDLGEKLSQLTSLHNIYLLERNQ
jgi:hypothetical protein